jgi:hypothetical protein
MAALLKKDVVIMIPFSALPIMMVLSKVKRRKVTHPKNSELLSWERRSRGFLRERKS